MTTKTHLYINQSLAACGFAVLSSQIAWKLRPDLWSSAQDCGISFSPRPVDHPHVRKVTAHLAGFGPVPVLTRSLDLLASRIGWITGYAVESINDEEGAQPVRPVAVAAVPSAEVPDIRAGKNYGVTTKEGPRSCSTCDNYTAGGACKAAASGLLDFVSGEYRPRPNSPRKCLGFAAKYGAMDGRDGRTLWPEIAAVVDSGNAPENLAAIEGARDYIASRLAAGPVPAADLIEGAAALGIAERTLQATAQGMGVVKTKAGMAGGWMWAFPEQDAA